MSAAAQLHATLMSGLNFEMSAVQLPTFPWLNSLKQTRHQSIMDENTEGLRSVWAVQRRGRRWRRRHHSTIHLTWFHLCFLKLSLQISFGTSSIYVDLRISLCFWVCLFDPDQSIRREDIISSSSCPKVWPFLGLSQLFIKLNLWWLFLVIFCDYVNIC